MKLLDLKTSPLKTALTNDISTARTVLSGDVGKIINAGKTDALAIVSDVLHITLLVLGKPTKIAAAQVKLANNIAALEKIETPLIDKTPPGARRHFSGCDNYGYAAKKRGDLFGLTPEEANSSIGFRPSSSSMNLEVTS